MNKTPIGCELFEGDVYVLFIFVSAVPSTVPRT